MRARLTFSQNGEICLESQYNPGFVQQLKTDIPYDSRNWDPLTKRWLVSTLYAAELLAALQAHGYQVSDERTPPAPAAAYSPSASPVLPADLKQALDILHLQHTTVRGVAEAVYKFYARKYHPDIGGDARKFQEINNAIETIRAYYP